MHFQTTDAHPPHHPQQPFEGRFSPAEQSKTFHDQVKRLRFPFNHNSASVHEHWQEQLAEHSFDPQSFYRTMQNMHDEATLHQDHQIGELVKELKARGEWANSLLIIASDPQPPAWEGALFGEFESHIPLMFVWPGQIEGGRRIDVPVSMIDVLPTILELAGLPASEIAQGQSLAPLLFGREGWQPRPLIFDEFRIAEDGSLIGNLEIVDGRWGSSLEIRESELQGGQPPGTLGRHPAPAGGRWKALPFADVPRLLTYDLEADPRALHHVANTDEARLRETQRRLWRLWREHRTLAATFTAAEAADLSPEQLSALRALGYIE